MHTLYQQLTTLKLSGLREALKAQIQQPNLYRELSFDERLALLLEHEQQGREQHRIERLIREARFRLMAHIEQIHYRADRQLDMISAMCKQVFIKQIFFRNCSPHYPLSRLFSL